MHVPSKDNDRRLKGAQQAMWCFAAAEQDAVSRRGALQAAVSAAAALSLSNGFVTSGPAIAAGGFSSW